MWMRKISFNRAELLVIQVIYQIIDIEGEICKTDILIVSTKLTCIDVLPLRINLAGNRNRFKYPFL